MKLFAVVVVYKMQPSQSPTIKSLVTASRGLDGTDHQLCILIWDNTPGGQDPGELPGNVAYRAAPQNPGLSVAYNWSMDMAAAGDCDWLLTLDQDTVLPPHFLTSVCSIADFPNLPDDLCAIVPRVVGDGRELSPFRFLFSAIPEMLHRRPGKKLWSAAYAVNSAATLRISSLLSVGGYDPLFPLDISDMNLFHRFARTGKRVYFADELLVNHDFSMLKKQGRMSLERYDAQLIDECAFWDLHMGHLARCERLFRLFGRMCIEYLEGDDPQFRQRTLRELVRRLGTGRKVRIEKWRQFAERRAEASRE